MTNQPQLVELLGREGIAATQATVSRDLEDLGAVKVRVPGGETVYAIPEYEPSADRPARPSATGPGRMGRRGEDAATSSWCARHPAARTSSPRRSTARA